MYHPICKIIEIINVTPFVVVLLFDDGTEKKIDLKPVLKGEMYSPLNDFDLFKRIELNTQIGTIFWPNGADFDPSTLYLWEDNIKELLERSAKWVNL